MTKREQRETLDLLIHQKMARMKLAMNNYEIQLLYAYYFQALGLIEYSLDLEIIGICTAETYEQEIKNYKENLINGQFS